MLVDGLFIGNYVGVTALAAVNLIIPISTLLFGVGMMLSIGGSVRAGKYLGEHDHPAASAIFSKTLVCMALYGVAAISLALAFEEAAVHRARRKPGTLPGDERVLPHHHAVSAGAAHRARPVLLHTAGTAIRTWSPPH